jgi:hypothetical protein
VSFSRTGSSTQLFGSFLLLLDTFLGGGMRLVGVSGIWKEQELHADASQDVSF